MRNFLNFIFPVLVSVLYPNAALSQEQQYQPNDLVVLFSKVSDLKTTQNLKGDIVLPNSVRANIETTSTLEYCGVWYTDDFQHLSAEMGERIFDIKIRETFGSFNTAYNGALVSKSCGGESNGVFIVRGNETDILLLQYKAVSAVNFEEFEPVAIISEIDVQEAKSNLEQQDIVQKKELEELGNRYLELSESAINSHLGSINLSYPEKNEKIKLCTLKISGDEAVPFLQYPLMKPDQTFTTGLRQAMKNADTEFSSESLYQGVFDDLEEFFQQWQVDFRDATTCNTFVAYPVQLLEFTNAAKRINENFSYEFNGLLEVNELQEAWAKSYGFASFTDSKFADAIGVNAENLEALLDFDVDSLQKYKTLVQEMNKLGYADGENFSTVIEFLNDRSTGLQDGITALEVKQKRDEKKRLAEAQKEEERQRRIEEAQLQRAERIASGNGEFTHYSDGSCKEGDNETCITKDELIALCSKVTSYYNRGYGTIFGSVSLMDYKLRELEDNMGKNAYSEAETYVSKGGDCIFSFKASGTAGGDYIDRTYYCKVTSLFGKDGSFGTIGLDSLSCSYR